MPEVTNNSSDPAATAPQAARSADEIQQWIVNHLANTLQKPAEQIDVTVPFDDFALDSVTALGMTGELEVWLGKKVDPTLLFDYPTIEQLAAVLSEESRS